MKNSVRTMVTTAMLAAVAGALMSLEFSIPFMPVFYKIDFSDVPTVIALFSFGPVSAFCVEIIKILIKLITVGTNSNYVGEFANLLGAVMFIVPIWLIAKRTGGTKRGMAAALGVSAVIRIAWSCFCNACITLPMYAATMGVSIDDVVRAVSAANPMIRNLPTFLILATIPFNAVKLALNYSLAVALFYRVAAAIPMPRVFTASKTA